MYAQLGTIRFEGPKGFTSFEETFGVNYAQHERINGKPRIQAVGDELNGITFDMYLHAQFTDPEVAIDEMKTAMQNREILTFVLGNGKVVGDFVITTFTKNTSFTDALGNIIEATLSVELLESFNEDRLLEENRQAKNTAFATTARNSNVRSVLDPKLSPASVVVTDVAKIETSGKMVNQYTAAVEKNPATVEYYSGKINSELNSMESGIQKLQNELTNAQDLLEFAQSLPTALQSVNSRVQDLRAILPITDIQNFKVINRQLQGSILAAKSANIGINNQAIIRRK